MILASRSNEPRRLHLVLRWLLVGAGALALSACTSVLGDFKIAETNGSTTIVDASVDAPVPTTCNGMRATCRGNDQYVCGNTGEFALAQRCPFLCTEGVCTGECSPTTFKCEGKNALRCNEQGAWEQPGTLCDFECTGTGATGCSDCAPDQKKCVGAGISTCDIKGAWGDPVPCEFTCTGASPAAMCGGECKMNTRRCNGNQPQLCQAGTWADDAPCVNTVCSMGTCVASCTEGAHQCQGNISQTCTNGMWVSASTACPFACQMATGLCGGECVPASKRCISNTTLQTCDSNGVYGPPTACAAVCGVVNNSYGCTGTCRPGDLGCDGLMPQKCNQTGAWEKVVGIAQCVQACVAGQCALCNPGAKRCSASNNSEICSADGSTWTKNGTCTSGCNADGGVCNPSTG